MGFERNYLVKILTNQLNNRRFSTLATQTKIKPWFITGFSDVEASFIILIYQDENSKTFPNIVAVTRPHYKINNISNPYWISGFIAGDSTFFVSIEKSSENKVGHRFRLKFGSCLHIRDRNLLIGIANYFNILNNNLMASKYIYDSATRETNLLQIKNNSDIINKIIPFFDQYPILGIKSLDFADFKKVAELVKNKEHLTESGFS